MKKNKCVLLIDETDGGLVLNGQRNLYYQMEYEEFIKSELCQKYGVGDHESDYIKNKIKNRSKEQSNIFFFLRLLIPNFLGKVDLVISVYFKNMKVYRYNFKTNRSLYDAEPMRYEDMLLFKEWITMSLSQEPYLSKEPLRYINVSYENWSIECMIDERENIPEGSIYFY